MATNVRKDRASKKTVQWGEVKKQSTQPEKLKPVNRRARRAIKAGRKQKGKV